MNKAIERMNDETLVDDLVSVMDEVLERMNELSRMNKEIMEYGDETLIDYWLQRGLPDNPTLEDFVCIAEDDFLYACAVVTYVAIKSEME